MKKIIESWEENSRAKRKNDTLGKDKIKNENKTPKKTPEKKQCEPQKKKMVKSNENIVKRLPRLGQDIEIEKKKILACTSPKIQKNKFKPRKPTKMRNFTPKKVNKIVDYFENLHNINSTSASPVKLPRLEGIRIKDLASRVIAERKTHERGDLIGGIILQKRSVANSNTA